MPLLVTVILTLLTTNISQAQQQCPKCGKIHYAVQRTVRSQPTTMNLAQQKAQMAARVGIQALRTPWPSPYGHTAKGMRHVGKNLGMGGGKAEGVGYSTRSPQDALNNCCMTGQRSVRYQGVARGRNGWYACKIYN